MLTDIKIKNAKAKERPYKLADSSGLFILIQPNGSKLWRLKYRYGGKEKLLSFGKYPKVGLADARQPRESAQNELRSGRDPSLTKRQRRAEANRIDNQFMEVSKKWLNNNKARWSQSHSHDVEHSLQKNVWPSIGKIALPDITAPMILEVLRPIERRSPETAHRVRQRISGVFVYGIACGLAQNDPASQLKGVLAPVKKGRQPAITDIDDLKEILSKVESEPAHPVVLLAHRFLALTSVRSGEVRGMKWKELEGDIWQIPAERMKMKRPHAVPLSQQAQDILKAVSQMTGNPPLVFPSIRWDSRPLSDMAFSMLLKRAGYGGRHVPHGWRSAFSSIMNERHPEWSAIIDLMLAHIGKDRVEAAYNRAEHLERRREIAQEWADLLCDGLKTPEQLLDVRRR